jgi:aminoglycoside 2'-N-acetyltransferase I
LTGGGQSLRSRTAVQLAHTSQLDADLLRIVRALLDEVFGADMDERAWDHALGGMHAIVWEAAEVVAHGAVVQRRLLHERVSLRTGYVESVAVRPDRRGCGHGAAVMDALERVIQAAYQVGALRASEIGAGFYRHRGWRQWLGRTWALTASGPVRTADEDQSVHVLDPAGLLDVARDLTCDWREGDVW